jgi:hypothetical protein
MARSSERTAKYAQKVIDSADIVREAIFRQLLSHVDIPYAKVSNLRLKKKESDFV